MDTLLRLSRILALWVIVLTSTFTMTIAPLASAYSQNDLNAIIGNTAFYDPSDTTGNSTGACSVAGTNTGGAATSATNVDYAGKPVLSEAQVSAIAANQSFYVDAAKQADIPWQMIAVIHLRETGLKRTNPSNGQGIYQFVAKVGGPFPSGAVSDTEFARQTLLAANFIKGKASGANNYTHRSLTAGSDTDTVKDTFFSYNGRAQAYKTQAQTLGFTADQGYEGSPYVMNKADARRDPIANPSGWGQIKSDGGSLSYPANLDYGAFVEYAALSGIAIGSACTSGGAVNCSGAGANAALSETRQAVVCLAEQELAAWTSGALKPGVTGGYGKYSENTDENWCADFVSWIYNEAKYPLNPVKWRVPAVDSVQALGMKEMNFHYHPAGGYTPKPGDIIVHKLGQSHVNIVVGVEGNTMTIIGGNQHNDDQNKSIVQKYTDKGFAGLDGITGYVTPD